MQGTELNTSHAGGQSTRENIFDEFKSKSVGTNSAYVNVAHMIYDYKSLKNGPTVQQKMKQNLAQACFNRETDFESLPSL